MRRIVQTRPGIRGAYAASYFCFYPPNFMNRFPFASVVCAFAFILPATLFAGPADDLIRQGDLHDVKFASKTALESYLPAEKLEPNNVALLLKIARQYRHESQDAGSTAEKSRLAALALQYAQRAVALEPRNGEAHLSVAICYAKSLAFLGNKEKMNTLRVVKASVDQALALDPKQDLAWYILGCWNQRVAELGSFKKTMAEIAYGGLPDADDETAIKCFVKAIALNPNRLIHYIELGRTHAHAGNEAEARKYIQKGLAMANTGKDDAETKQRGSQTLAGL